MEKSLEQGSRDREKLKGFIHSEITRLFSSILDYTEVAVDGKDRYMNLRSRILKVSNDTIREIKRELDKHYQVRHVDVGEDMVVIDKAKKVDN